MATIELIKQLSIMFVTIGFAFGILAVIGFAFYYEWLNAKMTKSFLDDLEAIDEKDAEQ